MTGYSLTRLSGEAGAVIVIGSTAWAPWSSDSISFGVSIQVVGRPSIASTSVSLGPWLVIVR